MHGLPSKKIRNAVAIHHNAQQRHDFSFSCDSTTPVSADDDDISVALAFIVSLKSCAKQKDLQRGSTIHLNLVRIGLLEENVFVGNSLVNMYCKCGALKKAQEVFNQLPRRNTVSWNVLLAGLSQHGHGEEVLDCFEQMQLGGLSPDAFTFVCTLQACGSLRAITKGEEIYSQIMRECLLEKDNVLANAVVDMYAKCGALEKALDVFDVLPSQDVISWTSLITGYAQHGQGENALKCFRKMQQAGFPPDAIAFASVLKACGSIGALDDGQEIHATIVKEYVLQNDIVVANALLDMYAKCGAFEKAVEVFEELPARDVISWNALISGYAQHAHGNEALSCFENMQMAGFSPDEVTFACVLNACGKIRALDKGRDIHTHMLKDHFVQKHVMVANALIDMYAKCGALDKSQEVFDELPIHEVVSWNSLIAGCAQHGHGKDALKCFEQMQVRALSPDAITFACVLKACGSIRALARGQELHARFAKEFSLGKNIIVFYALVDMYAKCGALEKAQELFDKLPIRNLVVWTALMAGYAEHERPEEAINCFEQMQRDGFSPNAVTFACILKVCGNVGAVEKGHKLHGEITRKGLLEEDMVVGITLVVMYANCCMMGEAQGLFDLLPVRDIVLWSALMVGYAQLGKGEIVLNLFTKMTVEGVEPDIVSFTIVLNVCSRRCLLSSGESYFGIIKKCYGMIPTVQHLACMVDLFGRAGHLDEAIAVMRKSPLSSSLGMWLALLSACQKWSSVKVGTWAFENVLR